MAASLGFFPLLAGCAGGRLARAGAAAADADAEAVGASPSTMSYSRPEPERIKIAGSSISRFQKATSRVTWRNAHSQGWAALKAGSFEPWRRSRSMCYMRARTSAWYSSIQTLGPYRWTYDLIVL